MENFQKIKLLKLYEILVNETDEEHPLSTSDICQKLADLHITCDRRTLYKDMDLLNEFGYEVIKCRRGKENAYFIAEHGFSVPELRILIDAIHATKFITEKKSNELIEKLSLLAGRPESELLLSHSTIYNTRKHHNESIYYNISMIEDAIRLKKKVSFCYFDLDEKCNRIYRKEKRRYLVEPIALMIQDEKYYLLTYHDKYGKIGTYRLDRMDSVNVEKSDISEDARDKCIDLSRYSGAIFNMYSGETQRIRLRFSDKLIGVIYDQYGEGIKIKRVRDNLCECDVEVEISPTFWGWLFQFAGEMEIVKPERIKEEYKERCRKVFMEKEKSHVKHDL